MQANKFQRHLYLLFGSGRGTLSLLTRGGGVTNSQLFFLPLSLPAERRRVRRHESGKDAWKMATIHSQQQLELGRPKNVAGVAEKCLGKLQFLAAGPLKFSCWIGPFKQVICFASFGNKSEDKRHRLRPTTWFPGPKRIRQPQIMSPARFYIYSYINENPSIYLYVSTNLNETLFAIKIALCLQRVPNNFGNFFFLQSASFCCTCPDGNRIFYLSPAMGHFICCIAQPTEWNVIVFAK